MEQSLVLFVSVTVFVYTQAYPFPVQYLPKPLKRFQNNDISITADSALQIGCLHMESLEGEYYYESRRANDEVCGMYIIAAENQLVQIDVVSTNAECEEDGILTFFDGWELNGEYFPSEDDYPLKDTHRFVEHCGSNIPRTFIARQNAALIQFKLPKLGQGFRIKVSFPQNPQPCNVISMVPSGKFTLRNYGKRNNCSLSIIYPVQVNIVAIDVGQTVIGDASELTLSNSRTQCETKDYRHSDYVQFLDGVGLDTRSMREVAEKACGMTSIPVSQYFSLGCQNSVVRMVSSGSFYNSITVDFKMLEAHEAECLM